MFSIPNTAFVVLAQATLSDRHAGRETVRLSASALDVRKLRASNVGGCGRYRIICRIFDIPYESRSHRGPETLQRSAAHRIRASESPARRARL